MPQSAQVQQNTGPALTLERRVDIFPDKPLPEFESVGVKTYAARLKGDASTDLVAFICTSGLPPRAEIANAMRVIDNSSVLRLREAGIVHWPSHNAYYYAFAYERPLAPRYWRSLDETHTPMQEEALKNNFIIPMINALLEFQRTGIVHGGIRPTNIFWREGGTTPPQIGECLATPAGIGQPVLFEPIERGMCASLARGVGQHQDDCYAFGATLAMMMTGSNPLRGLDDGAIVRAKLEQGSFNAFLGNHTLGRTQIELMRGLLADDPAQRWGPTELEHWLSGRRMTPVSVDIGKKANRHFDFLEKEYWQLRPLAMDMAANVSEAAKIIENHALEKWLLHSFGDEERTQSVNEALDGLKESGKSSHYEDQLVTRVCMALDPNAPIRYRGLAVMPGGIAPMLVEAMIAGSNTQTLSEIIANQFATLWVNLQKDVKTEMVPLAQQLERVRSTIEKTSYGNGLERAVYELNPILPCLSPMLHPYYMTNVRRLLPVLEGIASSSNRPTEPMDRHLAAFLIVRDKCNEALFSSMESTELPVRRGLSLLTLFSDMQYHYGPERLPGLAAWLYPLVETTISRFLSKLVQNKTRQKTKEAVEQGNLAKLMQLVDDPESLDHDEQDFIAARQMYGELQAEIADIESRLQQRKGIVQSFGLPAAALLATVLAIVFMGITLVRAVLHNLG